MTKSKVYASIVNHLRKQWMMYSEERKIKLSEGRFKAVSPKSGREVYFHSCESCKVSYMISEKKLVVHHNIPVSSLKQIGLDKYIGRMFCDVSGLTRLCRNCHKHIHVNLNMFY